MKKNLMVKMLAVLLMVLVPAGLRSEKKALLHELINPEDLHVVDQGMYVTQGIEVFIYSLEDFKPVKQFGRKGEGPGEFMPFPMNVRISLRMVVCPQQLVINSMGRISFFSLDGEFQKEMRTKATIGRFKPVGSNFIGFNFEIQNKTNFVAANLYDGEMNKIKPVYRFKHYYQDNQYIDVLDEGVDYFDRVITWEDKIIIAGEDNILHVFDQQGNPRQKISLPVPLVRVTDAHKTQYTEFYRTDPRFKSEYEIYRPLVTFREYFLLVRRLFVDQGKIVIVTNNRKGEKVEIVIIDLEGKIHRQVFLPIREQNVRDLFPLDIKNGKIYQLIENEEEKWELQVTEMR